MSYVIEISPKTACYHIQTLEKSLKSNLNALRRAGAVSEVTQDYISIAVVETLEEAVRLCGELEASYPRYPKALDHDIH